MQLNKTLRKMKLDISFKPQMALVFSIFTIAWTTLDAIEVNVTQVTTESVTEQQISFDAVTEAIAENVTPATADFVSQIDEEQARKDGCRNGSNSYVLNSPSRYKTKCMLCELNRELGCTDPSDTKLTDGDGVKNCTYATAYTPGGVIFTQGCYHECRTVVTYQMCCPGFWGDDCQECPGGHDSPCSMRGNCSDHGDCQCEDGFSGFACELCENQDVYGKNCDQVCKCVHGDCNSGIDGDGSCDCFDGYEGSTCSISRQPDDNDKCLAMECEENAHCEVHGGEPSCICNHGYQWDLVKCIELNGCFNHTCIEEAECINLGLGKYECKCKEDYLGDGLVCLPIDLCQVNNGDCPAETTTCVYTGPNRRSCECVSGYENFVEGEGCVLTDVCPEPPQCHHLANCTTVGPFEKRCECNEGYIGDGYICYGNIIQRLQDLNTHEELVKDNLQQILHLIGFKYSEELSSDGFFTLFATVDSTGDDASGGGGFDKVFDQFLKAFFSKDSDIGGRLIREHVIAAEVSLGDISEPQTFYTLQGAQISIATTGTKLMFKSYDTVGSAKIYKSDIVAKNGLIHVIDKLFTPLPDPSIYKEKTLYEALKNDTRYNIFIRFIEIIGFQAELNDRERYTVFAPPDSFWKQLQPGTTEHLASASERANLIAIIKHHFIKGKVNVFDLVRRRRRETVGRTAVNTEVSEQGMITVDGKRITESDILVGNGLIHRIDGLLMPELANPLLPNQCDETRKEIVKGPCRPLFASTRDCPRRTDRFIDHEICHDFHPVHLRSHRRHDYVRDLFLDQLGHRDYLRPHFMLQTRSKCERTSTVKKCCPGFYGAECYSCPAGFQNPCSGNGQCDDGISGSGTCRCAEGFGGADCSYCRDPNMYGTRCNMTCECLHGECDNKASADATAGQCKPYSCQDGFMGKNCELQIELCDSTATLRCHAHAICVKNRVKNPNFGRYTIFENLNFIPRRGKKKVRKGQKYIIQSRCECKQGYEGDGVVCREINGCLLPDRGGCHDEAECVKLGPGIVNCTCGEGWEGDGAMCTPISLCATADCGVNSLCVDTAPGEMECICEFGYNQTDDGCLLIDLCPYTNGGCHERAFCETVTPEEMNCTCPIDTYGDGVEYCSGDLLYEIEHHSQLQNFIQWLQNISDVSSKLLYMENITLFAPTNEAFEIFYNKSAARWPYRKFGLLLGYHILPYRLSLDELETMNGESVVPYSDDFVINITVSTLKDIVDINDATILEGDIESINGVMHVINKVIEPDPFPVFYPTLWMAMEREHEFSIFRLHLNKLKTFESNLRDLDNFTVFAPINAAWDLVDHKDPYLQASRYFMYFIIPQMLTAEALKRMENATLPTLLGNDSSQHFIHINNINGQFFLNGKVVRLSPSDVRIEGGYIHGIDTVLQPVLNFCEKRGINGTILQECCAGFFGPLCEPCPGEVEMPCYNNGNCSDGIRGNGTCICNNGMTGQACEGCEDDNIHCDIDPCERMNGGCHPFSECKFDHGWVTCSPCMFGFVGDGHKCQTPCQANTVGCHENANCSFNFTSREATCSCIEDYVGDGKSCVHFRGECLTNNGGCDQNAVCSPVNVTVSDDVVCECVEDFIGNGYSCTGNVWHTVQNRNDTVEYLQYLNATLSADEYEALSLLLSNTTLNLLILLPTQISSTKQGAEEILSPWSYISLNAFHLPNSANETIDITAMNGNEISLATQCFYGGGGEECNITDENFKLAVETSNGWLILLKEPFATIQLEAKSSVSKLSKWWYIGGGSGIGALLIIVLLVVLMIKCAPVKRSAFMFQKFVDEDRQPVSAMVFHNAAMSDDLDDTLMPFGTEIQKPKSCEVNSYLRMDTGVLRASDEDGRGLNYEGKHQFEEDFVTERGTCM